jgi:hypothetical protein
MPELERELRVLGGSLAFPPTPDLAHSVVARLPAPAPARSRWPRRLAIVAAVLGIAVIAGLAIPQARSAILRVFGIGSVRVEYVDALPAVKPDVPLFLGPEISKNDAPFHLLESRLLGPPDGIYASGNVITFLYGSPDDVRLLVTQIGRPALEPEVVKKIVGATTNATIVQIEGSLEPGLWIEGEPHVLALPDAPERLARNTLVWTQGNLTLRLEGATSLDDAIRIAQSFR